MGLISRVSSRTYRSMGKSKKRGDKISSGGDLNKVLHDDAYAKPMKKAKAGEFDLVEESIVSSKMSAKILQAAQDQKDHFDMEEEHPDIEMTTETEEQQNGLPNFPEFKIGNFENIAAPEELDLAEEDEKALEMFMTANKFEKGQGIRLDDLIKQKMQEIDEAIPDQKPKNAPKQKVSAFPPEVEDLFRHIGVVMSKYRSGKFPKAFRQIPQLREWEEALFLTEPNKWTAASVNQATKIFASAMSENMAQRYYNLVLLPRVRDDISFYKKLNFHLFEAVMKSVFKPISFFRGFLLPLAKEGNCTLREATILAAILRDNSIFLRTLIEKKYVLPYRVIDALVFHFLALKNDSRKLPVLWHQCLLSFVRIYSKDASNDQKRALLKLIKVQNHGEISAEIRETILKTSPRDIEVADGSNDVADMSVF